MKRAPSEDLFRLIKSLSKGEKRNFKLLAGLLASDKDKKYIELFDVIDKQDSYDETRVLKQVKGLYGGQLAVGKHYLYRLILRSLAYFRSNPSTELAAILDQSRALAERELYAQASKHLRKGLQEAVHLEDFGTHYAMLGLQLDLIVGLQSDKDLKQRVAQLESEREALLDKMSNLDRYRSLVNKAMILIHSSGVIDVQAVRALRDEPLLQNIGEAKSVRARLLYNALHRKLCLSQGDLKGALAHSEHSLQLYETNPLIKADSVKDFYQELNKVCITLLQLKRYEESKAKMEEFSMFRQDFPRARVDFYKWYFALVLGAGIHMGTPEHVEQLEHELRNDWSDMEGKLPKAMEMWLRYLMAYSYFMIGKPGKALPWLNLILADPKSDTRLNVQLATRLVFLMVHFELGNHILFDSELKSIKRFMERHGLQGEYERLALKCLKAISNAAGTATLRKVIENWHARMVKADASAKGKLPEMADISGWLSCLLSGKTLAKLRREQVSERELTFLQGHVEF